MDDTPYAQVGCIVLLNAAFAGFGAVLGAANVAGFGSRVTCGGSARGATVGARRLGAVGWELRLWGYDCSFGWELRLEASVGSFSWCSSICAKAKGIEALGIQDLLLWTNADWLHQKNAYFLAVYNSLTGQSL